MLNTLYIILSHFFILLYPCTLVEHFIRKIKNININEKSKIGIIVEVVWLKMISCTNNNILNYPSCIQSILYTIHEYLWSKVIYYYST